MPSYQQTLPITAQAVVVVPTANSLNSSTACLLSLCLSAVLAVRVRHFNDNFLVIMSDFHSGFLLIKYLMVFFLLLFRICFLLSAYFQIKPWNAPLRSQSEICIEMDFYKQLIHSCRKYVHDLTAIAALTGAYDYH